MNFFSNTLVTEKKVFSINLIRGIMPKTFLLAWTSTLTTHELVVVLANVIRQEKENKGIQTGRSEIP